VPNASIHFIVPEDPSHIAQAAQYNYAVFEGMEDDGDEPDHLGFLQGKAGTVLSAYIEDDEMPGYSLSELIEALDKTGSPYFGMHDAYEEPSRGHRFKGSYRVNLKGGEDNQQTFPFPWEDGDPDVTDRAMRTAGIKQEMIDEIVRTFITPPPEPRP